ncbi:MAG: FkbM family methyltransferase [Candidatus Wallbacteria bacterium]|nr:FkbM family methyltransferase [Candidatus Wallbacteria bacterium]
MSPSKQGSEAAQDGDLRIELDNGPHCANCTYWFGAYEQVETRLFCAELRSGMTVVDAAANIGKYTLVAANRLGPDGKVFAFEPVDSTREQLERNVRLNGVQDRVEVLAYALGAVEKGNQNRLLAEGGESLVNCSGEPPAGAPAQQVQVTTLDRFLAERGIDRVDVLKLGTEGFELDILRGARELLARCHPILLLELVDSHLQRCGQSLAELREFLLEMGYCQAAFVDRGLRPSDELCPQPEGNGLYKAAGK